MRLIIDRSNFAGYAYCVEKPLQGKGMTALDEQDHLRLDEAPGALIAMEQTEDQPVSIDPELVQKAMNGDTEAFSQLFMLTYRAVFLTIRSVLEQENDILDALQTTYLRALQHMDQLKAPAAFYVWIRQIARNCALQLQEKNEKEWTYLPEADDMLRQTEDGRLPEFEQEVALDIASVLRGLPEEQARLLVLVYYDGLRLSEIARMDDKAPSTIRSRFRTAKKALIQALKARGIDKPMYSRGGLLSFLATSMRDSIGTGILSATVAQGILDNVLRSAKKPAPMDTVVAKLSKRQRNQALLRVASIVVGISVAASALTALALHGRTTLPADGPAPVYGYAASSAAAEGTIPTAPIGETAPETFAPPGNGPSAQTQTGTFIAADSTNPTAAVTGGSVSSPTEKQTNTPPSTAGRPTTTVPSGTTAAATTTAAAAFVPDYTPGQANTVGNAPNHLSDNRGYVAKQGDWLYYVTGNGYRYLMKMKTDGSSQQMVDQHESGHICLNVVGDWIYFCGNGLWRVRTDGSGKELMSTLNAWFLFVVGDTGYFAVEGIGDYTLYKIDLATGKTSVLKSSVQNLRYMAVQNDTLLYIGNFALYALQLRTGQEELIAALPDVWSILLQDNTLYYTAANGRLYALEYTRTDTPAPLFTAPQTTLIFYSPYQNGTLGFWPGSDAVGRPSTQTLAGKTGSWPSSIQADVGKGFYTFDNENVYFFTQEQVFCRARADGTDLHRLSQ